MVMLAKAAYGVSAYEMRGIGRLWCTVRRVCRSIAVGFSYASVERSRMGSRGIRDGLGDESKREREPLEIHYDEEGNDIVPGGDDKGSHLTGDTDTYHSNFTSSGTAVKASIGSNTNDPLWQLRR